MRNFLRLARGVLFCAAIACLGLPSLGAADVPPALERWLAPQTWQRDTEGPIVSLGKAGDFDDAHIFAPTVAFENDRFSMWYCGSRGTRLGRVFRLGLATSTDGKEFERYAGNPVLEFRDGEHSVLTPGLLHHGDGNALREDGKLRMWLSSTAFGKTGLHTLHETTSADGIHWDEPSPVLLEHVYCPTVLKSDRGYQLWYVDVSKRPWVIRYAESADGRKWTVREQPVLQLSQPWEAEIVVYPCVLKIDGVYLMWYGSYYSAVRRQTTAIGFAASTDGITWHKHPQNPVLKPEPERAWESHYVTSGSVMRLPDGSFRYWYASRTKPPFVNLYFAINTARWEGPAAADKQSALGAPRVLRLPPRKGDTGVLSVPKVDVLEVIDDDEAIVRAWYATGATELTFVDVWVQRQGAGEWKPGDNVALPQALRCEGSKSFDTTCGGRSVPMLVVDAP
jgi:predicted GH43/DUF377 family glycosyl hydrolase